MKKIKLILVFLGVIFILTSSYINKPVPKPALQQCFEFTGYDMMEPLDWTLISVPEPTCNYTGGSICYIRAEKEPSVPHPTAESLIDLSNNSSNFTQPYMGIYGKVRLKP